MDSCRPFPFLENLLPLCDLGKKFSNLDYGSWIRSEVALSTGNKRVALKHAKRFKKNWCGFHEKYGYDGKEAWEELYEGADPKDDEIWPSEYFMHPGLADIESIPLAKQVDDQITELS